MPPEFKLIAAALIVALFVLLPLLLFRAGRLLRYYVLPLLPLACGGLLALLEPNLFEPAVATLLLISGYVFYTYLVAGSIEVDFRFAPTPLNNTVYLALSALGACVLGGVGATLVLLGPLVRANRTRLHSRHVPIFFLIVVTNLGGLPSPVGSAHLYVLHGLGMHAARFLELLPFWLVSVATVLLVFLAYDALVLSKEPIQTDPRADLYEDLYRALQSQQVPQSLLLRTIDYLESPKAMFRGGTSMLVPLGLGAITLSGMFGNAYHWREVVLACLALVAALALWRRPEAAAGPRLPFGLLWLALIFFASMAFIFLPLWSRSLAAAGAASALVVKQPLFALLQALAGWLDSTTALLGVLATRLPPESAGLALSSPAPEAWRTLLNAPGMFVLCALLPALVGGLTYASDQANLVGRRVSEVAGIIMPGFFTHFLVALPVTLVGALPSALLYYWLFGLPR